MEKNLDLHMIKDGKIKDRTNIIDNLGKKYIYYDSTGNLNEITQLIGDDEETERMYQFTPYQLISYTFEIIEEIEKPKKINDFKLRQEKGETLIGANMWSIMYKLNEQSKAINYLLEKEK